MALTIFPYVYLYAFYKIRKLRLGLLLNIGLGVPGALIQYLLPWPYGVFATWGISIPVMMYFVRKWSIAWNETIDKQGMPSSAA